MEKNQFYLPLNLPDIRDEILPKYIDELLLLREQEEGQSFLGFTDKTIPSTVIELFSKLGLTPCTWKINMFTSPALEKQTIHLDGDPAYPVKFRPFGINWVWGGRTVMEWYQNKHPALPEATIWQEFRYVVFDEHNVELLTRATLSNATLVNITYPHRVINASKERRFCFSVCSEEVITWEEITDLCYKHGLVRE